MEWKRMLSAALAGLILVPALTLPALAAQETGAAGETFEDKALHAIELAGRYGGADSVRYALWEDGEITAQGGWGVYSKTENRALTEDILYGIGSVSKTYTAAAVLKLAQDGKLKLEDPVTKYLPGFTMADERYKDITVRMLLDHSSGLMGDTTRDAFLFGDTDESAADDLLKRLATQRLKADPGAYCVYSNDGYTLAQLVVEAVSGMDFMDYLHAAILDPAGLTNTYAPGDDFDTGLLARTYASAEDTRALPQDTVGIVGTGGLYATAADLASFGGLLCGNDLLSQEWLDLMNTDWAVKGLWPENSENDTLAYGLGWDNVHQFPFNQSGITALVKGGDTLRYHASLIVLPEENKAVAVLSSGGVSTYNQLAGERILIDALAEDGVTVNETYALPKSTPAVMPEALKANAGTYASLGLVATVAFPDDKTMTLTNAAALGGTVQTFTYQADGTFLDETGSFLMKFVTEANGRTYLYQEGYTAVPGLTVLGTANYALEKLEPNTEADQAALDAWGARGSELYLIVNEKYTSQVYLSGPFAAVTSMPETSGYVAGFERIVDETLARQYVQLPGTGSRNGADYQMVTVDGKEYLKAGDYLCAPASGLGNLYAGAGAYCTILDDGYARWFNVGDLAGKTLTVTLPETGGGFTVYDASGVVTASSVAYGDTSAVLPEGGWVVFAGDAGARFYLSLAE